MNIKEALADFAQNPLEYDLSEMMDDEEIQEMARNVEALRKELYEAAGRNRDYHVKAADVKPLLSDWKGADGSATPSVLSGINRIQRWSQSKPLYLVFLLSSCQYIVFLWKGRGDIRNKHPFGHEAGCSPLPGSVNSGTRK